MPAVIFVSYECFSAFDDNKIIRGAFMKIPNPLHIHETLSK